MDYVKRHRGFVSACAACAAALWGVAIFGQDDPLVKTEPLPQVIQRTQQEKPTFAKRQQDLLNLRYDLANRPAPGVTMSRGKAVQDGVRVKLAAGMTWDKLAAMTPDEIKAPECLAGRLLPASASASRGGRHDLPEAAHRRDEETDRARSDALRSRLRPARSPDPGNPAAGIFLVTRPDLGDVSKGELVTLDNFERLFKEILNPKQLEGLRLLLTPFPQQQFNLTEDRRSVKASQGVACFDCHANGHTNSATHTVGDIRPNEHRHRIDTPSLRGVGIQRLFGSQRALKSVEDFTEFEQRAAYFDGDHTRAARKGVNPLERGSQVHFMGEFQNLLDFPPAPKLNILGRLDPAKTSEAERRGEALFFGKAQCSICHAPPYYTDNLMHNLQVERFFKERVINGRKASADGPIKTFPLRGIKDSPPYLHDDRLLTLDDTVEFFNLVLGLKLLPQEKKDLVAFLRAL